jgi:hypothetical protein
MALLVNRDLKNGGTVTTAHMSTECAAATNALSPGAFLAVTNIGSGSGGAAAASGGGLYGDKLMVVCWRGRGQHMVNVMCNKDALHVVGHRLMDMGVKVTFPVAEVAEGNKAKVSGWGDNEDDAAAKEKE